MTQCSTVKLFCCLCVLSGSAAEDAGIQTGDKIVSVNKEDISRLTHMELVSLIKKV